jgi:nigerose phosphorylase
MTWLITEHGFNKKQIACSGNKFMIGNGTIGVRGTLEEYTKNELTATILSGLFDKVGDGWREPVNAPNALSTRVYYNCRLLSVLETEPEDHIQELDIRHGIHRRRTVFRTEDGNAVTVSSERFVSLAEPSLIAMKFTVSCREAGDIVIKTGIDADVWDINGPHLEGIKSGSAGNLLLMEAVTHEQDIAVAVAEGMDGFGGEVAVLELGVYRTLHIACTAGSAYSFRKFAAIRTGTVGAESAAGEAVGVVRQALTAGYESCLRHHMQEWEGNWKSADIRIDGDEEAELALRYSMYQLLVIAPYTSERVSIPARGLSGQVYKGAVFWDTEMFMLPFFLHTAPEVARNLLLYRVHTLDGAKRKAAEYGFRGAFYAWESQDTGDDACTLFNVTDVFTKRPLRTYFRDKQVHISADVAHGIWQYYLMTGDEGIFLEGGAEVILECARFFYSYAFAKPDKNRYEIVDVTGPDEYHERVNNNAFTNYMVLQTLVIALRVVEMLQMRHPEEWLRLKEHLDYSQDLEQIRDMHDRLYVPQPDEKSFLIEQFDGYLALENPTLEELKGRVLHPNEYWGGGTGLATTTQIIKQADVVLLLHLFGDQFSQEVKEANWKYYEPRTEHGSSLSACIYALVAADLGMPDWAYPYFMKTATIDMTGNSKQYVGDLYIGGTHPAANGGAWMAAVQGFAGVRVENGMVRIRPSMPKHWEEIRFTLQVARQSYAISVSRKQICVKGAEGNTQAQRFRIGQRTLTCSAGEEIREEYGG